MSDGTSNAASSGPERDGQGGETVASDVDLHDVVDRADVRRAPRYSRFLLVGVVAGLVIGLVVSLIFLQTPEAEAMMKPGVYVTVMTAFIVTFTTLVAGLLAVLADRRSLSRFQRGRAGR
ncbi:hypothetical protein [Myceligenerans crystallogenes]|uniref:Uncharacterized protein n=1 Tax=Myceligenerans crystallogenes TaxID=316335 RepID=A0ABN2NF80_9MICO